MAQLTSAPSSQPSHRKIFVASVGDQSQRIPGLLLVKMAERAFLRHAVRFSHARGAAEMPNEANVAPLNVFDFTPRDQAERRAVQNLFDRLAKQIAALESRKANKFAAREEVAIRKPISAVRHCSSVP